MASLAGKGGGMGMGDTPSGSTAFQKALAMRQGRPQVPGLDYGPMGNPNAPVPSPWLQQQYGMQPEQFDPQQIMQLRARRAAIRAQPGWQQGQMLGQLQAGGMVLPPGLL